MASKPPIQAIYDHLHDYRAGWGLLVLCFIFTVYRYNALPQKALSSKHFLHFLYGLGVALVLTYVLAAVLYLIYPNYLNQSEASVAAVSWLAIHGAPIYPDWRSGDVYGLPYGPLLFITNGATLLLVPSILGSKLAGWVAVVSALPLLYFILRSKGTDRRVSFLLCLAAIALLSSFHEHSHAFWNRPEPFLILLTTLTLLAAQQLPTSAAAIAIGILAGLAADFKLPQGLCAMPAALAVCGSGNSWKTRCSLALLLLAGLSVIALPFLVSFRAEATIEGYISLVLTVANHGWSAGVLKDNVLFGLTLLAPIFLVRCLRGPMFLKPFRVLAISWLTSLAKHDGHH